MRIIIVCEYLNARGGTARQAIELANALREGGQEVALVTRVFDRERCYPELTAGLNVIGRGSHEAVAVSAGATARGPRPLLRKLARGIGLHYVTSRRRMGARAEECETLLRPLVETWPDAVLNPHDFGPAAWACARIAPKRTVWQCNDPIYKWAQQESACAAAVRRWAIRDDVRQMEGIGQIAVLDSRVASVVVQRFGRRPRIVRSGVNIKQFRRNSTPVVARRRLGLELDAPVFLVISLLSGEYRRTIDALSAARNLSGNATLLLAVPRQHADEKYLLAFEAQYRNGGGTTRLHWLDRPFTSEEEQRIYFHAADALVFPNAEQTWGLAVLEAAAAGCLPIVSKGAGVSEILTHAHDSLLFDAGNIDQLRICMQRVQDDRTATARMAANAQSLMERDYTWQKYSERMMPLFAEVARRN
jgi:glycosyltransferase involved in cell wall biosynthesis